MRKTIALSFVALSVLVAGPAQGASEGASGEYPVKCVQHTMPNGMKTPAVCILWPLP
jgi:hypothetical protein